MKPPKKEIKELLRLERVSIRRDGKTVLSGISWRVHRREHWVVLGPNGSGKSTLFEILMGYLWPQQGSVHVMGETYGKAFLPEIRKQVGFIAPWVFRAIREDATVDCVVASGWEGGTVFYQELQPRMRKQIRAALKQVGALRLESRRYGSLSSGEQFRVAMARAFIAKPAILILDEPFSLLDMGARHRMYQLLQKIARSPSGPSLLMTTHHGEDIRPFFTHALLLKKGKVFAQGICRKGIRPTALRRLFEVPKMQGF